MKPFQKIIGVKDSTSDWSIEILVDNDTTSDETSNNEKDNDGINLGDFIVRQYDATVDIDMKYVYNATCVKEDFISHPISKDHLKSVCTMSSSSSSDTSPKFIYVCDPVVVTKSTKS